MKVKVVTGDSKYINGCENETSIENKLNDCISNIETIGGKVIDIKFIHTVESQGIDYYSALVLYLDKQ